MRAKYGEKNIVSPDKTQALLNAYSNAAVKLLESL